MSGKSPFEILGQGVNLEDESLGRFTKGLGIPYLAYTLEAVGIMSAIVIILLSMFSLLVVNYPKTVAQTKQRIAQAVISVLFIAILPLALDVVYNTCLKAFYG